jgi:hypothetical protein
MGPDCGSGGGGSAPPPPFEPPAGDEDGAVLIGSEFPETIECGETATARVTMQNSGTRSWKHDDAVRLGAIDDSDPLNDAGRIELPPGTEVMPGGQWTFEFALRAPDEAGSYTTDWRMVREWVRWFGDSDTHEIAVICTTPSPTVRHGRVRLDGNAIVDDDGPFVALGASLFWGAWGYRHDRARLEDNLEHLSVNAFDYVRVLGVVGNPSAPDWWDGREVDFNWPDYVDVIAGFTDLAYDVYGLRVEWTLIGDGQVSVPTESQRYQLVDRFLQMSQGREHKIMHFEIANESWQNGFGGDAGLAQLRSLTSYMQARTDILVAASAPAGHDCADVQAVYGGGVGDLATIHFDRQNNLADGPWRPVRQPWEHAYCTGVPPGSNNEPIGPGSSVASESEPVRLVAAAINTWMSNLPMYVFHTRAGIRGDQNLWDMPGTTAFAEAREGLPGDLPNWNRKNAHWSDSPFRVYAQVGGSLYPDQMWPDLAGATAGAVRAYGQVRGGSYAVFPIGIRDHVRMEARRAMTYEVVDPMTGDLLAAGTLEAGQWFEARGAEALIVTGSFL